MQALIPYFEIPIFEWGPVVLDSWTALVMLGFIIGLEITKKVKLRSTVGTQRGGLKCVGGVCRVYPSFSGYQFELSANHDFGG